MDDPGHPPFHECQSASQEWGSSPRLEIRHQQPELCPLSVETGDQLEVGGTIVETSAPDFPTGGEASSMSIKVFENYRPIIFHGWGILRDAYEAFAYDSALPDAEWSAQAYLVYSFGLNPDWLHFDISCWVSCGFPMSYVRIDNGGPE